MKKTLYIISALLLGLVSCTQMQIEAPELAKPEETGLVAVTMKLDVPVPIMAFTKAGERSHTPDIDYIKVAVFGTSGYPQTYALAEPVGSYATTNGDTYTFKVLLPVYEGEAHVHIIANGDESIKFVDENETSIMESMKSENNIGAYWARVVLEDGILPQKDQNGIMQTDSQGNFIPSDETKAQFENLTLVRNFAEVVLTNEAGNLTDVSWTLVNIPKSGSVAPMSAGTYVDDYAAYEYDAETGRMVNGSKVYEGFMFDGAMDYTVPTEDTFSGVAPGASNFVYERPLPGTDKATCILVRAKFSNGTTPDGYYTYYRLDLMDEAVDGYFPIYRNYKYQVKIHRVGNRGATTIAEAMNRDSGGNVSMSTEAMKLTDISDGSSRLFVEYTDKVFTSGGKKTLFVQYIPDVTVDADNDGNADVDNTKIQVKIKTQGTALANTTITLLPTSTQTGYYYYQFEVNDQDENADLTSVLQVIASNGKTGDDKSTLYRDINLRVMKKMDFELSLEPKQVSGITTTVLSIALPDDLPSSVFPLLLYIEDVNHTLSPTQKDGAGNAITLPVQTGKSLADGTTNSFYYIRTVNESEYNANHTITTEFETVVSSSATTIYVANEYFKTHNINLLNDGIYVNPTHATVEYSVTSVQVEIEAADASKSWTVTGGSGVTVSPASGTGSGSFTMTFEANNSTTQQVVRRATVTSDGVSHVVYITQLPLEFSLTPASQEVAFNATTAEVTIHADEGQAWTATVTGPNGTNPTISAASGEGTQTLTVTIPSNSTTSSRNFTVTANMGDSDISVYGTITQKAGPASPYTFNASAFTINNRTGSLTSSDGYVTVSVGNAAKNGTGTGQYLTMGYRQNLTNNRGTITITPQAGFKITNIKITYSDSDYANYEWGNTDVEVSSGSYVRDGNNSTTGTWTGSSTTAITFTNGHSATWTNTGRFPRITSIVVTYEPI